MIGRAFVWGGFVAGVVLLALGIGTAVVALTGKSEVRDRLAAERIVGTPDMTPEATEAALAEAGLDVEAPDCSVAGEEIDTGSEAQCFADYMRIHALQSTEGAVYAEMPRVVDAETGEPIPDEEASQALEDGTGIDNPKRQIWVTETALSTALNTSYFAEQVVTFSLVVGLALIVIGIGILVLTFGTLRPRVEESEAGGAATTSG